MIADLISALNANQIAGGVAPFAVTCRADYYAALKNEFNLTDVQMAAGGPPLQPLLACSSITSAVQTHIVIVTDNDSSHVTYSETNG